jgi:cell division protein FtsB
MAVPSTKLVIRRRAPVRTAVLTSLAGVAGAVVLYLTYELGRFDAGYDRQAVAQQRVELEVQMQKLEKKNQELRTHVAELETAGAGASRVRAELTRTLGDLQTQVTHQAQDLAFFRNVVVSGEPALGVRIQQLRITAGDAPGHFKLRLTLVQTARPDKDVSGAVSLKVDGKLLGQPSSLDLAALTGSQQKDQQYSFRYFQMLDDDIALPINYRPEQLTAEISSSAKEIAPVTQSFPWHLDTT